MKVTLTGATGFIGSHILTDLQKHGHAVIALVRDDAQADAVAARGATPALVDLYDRPAVTRLLSRADGAIHTASPGDATSANLDAAVVDAATSAFAGTGQPYLQIGGLWIYGANTAITEESRSTRRRWWRGRCRTSAGCSTRQKCAAWWSSPPSPTAMAAAGFPAASRVAPGRGWQPDHARRGPAALADGARRRPGGLLPARAGRRIVPRPLRHRQRVAPDRGRADRGGRGRGRRPGSGPRFRCGGRARLGDYFAEVLLLDQGTDAARARAELGWLRPIRR